jgi:16S rRNA (guanine1207-N2)-methyltransferase
MGDAPTTPDPPRSGAPGHYFDVAPASRSDEQEVVLDLPDGRLHLVTDRGVFSHGRIDPGTKLLLLRSPHPPASGHLLDLGCGAGPIALALARRAPAATVWAVDVNERARRLCARNAERNGLANVVVAAPDEVPPEVVLDGIWSNPPIRIGKAALHELLLTWLARLGPSGTALLVVQRNLGADSLQTWLTAHGYPTERWASARGYRLLRARRAGGSLSGGADPLRS